MDPFNNQMIKRSNKKKKKIVNGYKLEYNNQVTIEQYSLYIESIYRILVIT